MAAKHSKHDKYSQEKDSSTEIRFEYTVYHKSVATPNMTALIYPYWSSKYWNTPQFACKPRAMHENKNGVPFGGNLSWINTITKSS